MAAVSVAVVDMVFVQIGWTVQSVDTWNSNLVGTAENDVQQMLLTSSKRSNDKNWNDTTRTNPKDQTRH